MTKPEVRQLAHAYDLPNKDRKDSQGICFLGKIKFTDFVRHHMGTKKGLLIEYETGRKVGEHEGVWFYTVGQRSGIGLSGGPWYVVKKSMEDNTVFISRAYYSSDKTRTQVSVTDFNWISGTAPLPGAFSVKLRHGPDEVPGVLEYAPHGGLITLSHRDQGIAAGQFAAFYDRDLCLGSAVIIEQG